MATDPYTLCIFNLELISFDHYASMTLDLLYRLKLCTIEYINSISDQHGIEAIQQYSYPFCRLKREKKSKKPLKRLPTGARGFQLHT